MIGLLERVGGVLIAPRRTLANLSPETGQRDGAALLGAYLLAVGLLPIGDAVANFWALRSLGAAPGLLRGLLPALPWLLGAAALDWLLGAGRVHRVALCLVPLLVIEGLAHLLGDVGVALPGPAGPPLHLRRSRRADPVRSGATLPIRLLRTGVGDHSDLAHLGDPGLGGGRRRALRA